MVYALVDCNNFFVSCERVFQPSWNHRPVVVLSNNDGCIVSRSAEVKALGVPMGAPYFQWKSLFEKEKVIVRSSNFNLYTNLSQRVSQVLREFSEDQYIYSVDESFLSFSDNFTQDWSSFGQDIADRVFKCTGIPVSVGFAKTKTMAKLATEATKRNLVTGSSCSLVDMEFAKYIDFCKQIDISDVWGIGRQSAKKLRNLDVQTVANFLEMSEIEVKRQFNIVGLRTWKELRGEDCISLHDIDKAQKGILSSRSFGQRVSSLVELEISLSNHIETVARKLRLQSSKANNLSVYIVPAGMPRRSYIIKSTYLEATDYTPDLLQIAKKLLRDIYKPNTSYKKIGVFLGGIEPKDPDKINLFEPEDKLDKHKKAMQVFDSVRLRFGSTGIAMASSVGLGKWRGKSAWHSPDYTTSWQELKIVK